MNEIIFQPSSAGSNESVDIFITISDPQGLDDIVSVWVETTQPLFPEKVICYQEVDGSIGIGTGIWKESFIFPPISNNPNLSQDVSYFVKVYDMNHNKPGNYFIRKLVSIND